MVPVASPLGVPPANGIMQTSYYRKVAKLVCFLIFRISSVYCKLEPGDAKTAKFIKLQSENLKYC